MSVPDLRRRQDIPDNNNNRDNIGEKLEETTDNILEIMRKDFYSCFKNPIVTMVLIAIIIIPSLYALVNIYACWDPYGNTGDVLFAIANEDQGATYENYTVNAGNDLVDSLKNDTNFNWQFVSTAELKQGVHNGKYAAGIIIPRNFSESITSIVSDNPHSADLEYYSNLKTNPVAGKLTDSGVKAVYNKMNAEIVSFIDVAAYGKLDELQDGLANGSKKMESGADKLDNASSEVQSGAKELISGADEVSTGADALASGSSQLASGAGAITSGAYSLASGASELASGSNTLASGSNQLAIGANSVSDGATELATGASKLSSSANQVASGASSVSDGSQQIATQSVQNYQDFLKLKQLLNNNGDTQKLVDDADKIASTSSTLSNRLKTLSSDSSNVSEDAINAYSASKNLTSDAYDVAVTSYDVAYQADDISDSMANVSSDMSQLKEAMNSNDQSQIQALLKKIDIEMNMTNQKFAMITYGSKQVANGSSQIAGGASTLANGSKTLASGSSSLSSGAKELAAGAYRLSGGATELSTGANTLANGSSSLQSGANEVASGANELASGVHVLSNGTIKLATGATTLANASASGLRNASDSIGSLADQLHNLTKVSQDEVGDYFFSPVKLQRHEEYDISNYGSQVAPFYIVLSIWVGCIVTTTMLKPGISKGTKYKPYEMYLGKLLLFNIMALLETTVTIIGSILMGIDISNLLMFAFSCYFVSIVFMALIYSLVSVFGDIGKATAILLLVFQVSGTGGIYPIEIMSKFFGYLYPYLPMTYGITIVREAQLGLIWNNYLPAFAILLILLCVTVIIALILKQRWDERMKYFEDKMHETDLF